MEQTISDVELASFQAAIRGTNIDYAEIALTYLEVRAINSAPKTLVAAPGAGYVTEFISALLILDWVANAYVSNGILGVYETDSTGAVQSDTVDLADFGGQVADTMIVLQAVSADVIMLADKALVLSAVTGDSTGGDSPVRVKIAYRIHATGL